MSGRRKITVGTSAFRVEGGVANVRSFREKFPLATFRKATKTAPGYWVVPYSDVSALVPWADAQGYSVGDEIRDFAKEAWERRLSATVRSVSGDAPEGLPEVEGLTSSPLETQEVVIAAATTAWAAAPASRTPKGFPGTHRALIVADEPGLGKTLMALSCLRTEGVTANRAVIVCPTSLTENWQSEMNQHFEFQTFLPWVAQSRTPTPIPDECNVVIIGWDVLIDWAQTLIDWKPDAVVADEGHYAKAGKNQMRTKKEPKRDKDGKVVRDDQGNVILESVTTKVSGSDRATAVLDLGKAVAKNHGLVLALTGTPILNRPLELLPLLEFVGILPLFGGASAYKDRFCGPAKRNIGNGRTTTTYTGASHLLELNTRLRSSGHYIRRTKEHLVDAGSLPRKYADGVYAYDYAAEPKPWIIEATPEEMREYEAAVTEQRNFFTERAQEIASKLGSGMNTQRVREKVASEGARHLKRIGELRQAAARLKMRYVIHKVRQLVEDGEKVVIAAHHRDVVDIYAEAFSGLKIQGDMSVQAVEHAKRLFNETPTAEHPVLVLSVEAGKTGHTLCKQGLNGVGPSCARMVFAEQVWTPGDEAQAQDRIWRIGQDREVWITNALLKDSIDIDVFNQRLRKRRVVNTAIDAVTDEQSEDATARRGAGRIAQKLVYGE